MGNNLRGMSNRIPTLLRMSGFYLTRLRRASLSELSYRLGQAVTSYRAGRLARRGQNPCRIPSIALSNVRLLCLPAFRGHVERATVDHILTGTLFRLNADPDAVSRCERELQQRYCPSIRSIDSQVDIRAVWEAARLQHVTILCAWLRQQAEDPDNAHVKAFARSEILRWLTENPFLRGPHYQSAMECGLRLPVFFYALKTLDNLSSSDSETILKGVFLHAWWIEQNLSLFSSLGNHTVCEAMGLVIAGGVFRETEAGRRWLNTGLALLGQELSHQIFPDGGPAEQSFGYHRFVLDVYWLAVDFLECNNLRSCEDLKAGLLAGEGFLSAFSEAGGIIPAVGDYDDGQAMAPGLSPNRLAAATTLNRYRTFGKSGYTVVTGAGGLLLTLDHGLLGMPPLYGHGHADGLSVTLSIAETPFLVDCGTYRYNGVPDFRRYFKGTRAHNTVLIDSLDQATQLSGFVWGEPFSCRLERVVETGRHLLIEASHDGYTRLDEPVRHTRSILADTDGSCLITDTFQGSGLHNFELNFHFHPEVLLAEQAGGWLAKRDGHGIRFELASGSFLVHRGEEDPPLGWFSPTYNMMVPSQVLQASWKGEPAGARFETRITIM